MPHLLSQEGPYSRPLRALGLKIDDVRAYADLYNLPDLNSAAHELTERLEKMEDQPTLGHEIEKEVIRLRAARRLEIDKIGEGTQSIIATRRSAAEIVLTRYFGEPITP